MDEGWATLYPERMELFNGTGVHYCTVVVDDDAPLPPRYEHIMEWGKEPNVKHRTVPVTQEFFDLVYNSLRFSTPISEGN